MRRALIDWDFEARSVWIINSPRERPSRPSQHRRPSGGSSAEGSQQLRPWCDLLTTSLLDSLQRWNDWGCSLGESSSVAGDQEWESFYRAGKHLAEVTQQELGDQWQVLWAARGAWHFVHLS